MHASSRLYVTIRVRRGCKSQRSRGDGVIPLKRVILFALHPSRILLLLLQHPTRFCRTSKYCLCPSITARTKINTKEKTSANPPNFLINYSFSQRILKKKTTFFGNLSNLLNSNQLGRYFLFCLQSLLMMLANRNGGRTVQKISF